MRPSAARKKPGRRRCAISGYTTAFSWRPTQGEGRGGRRRRGVGGAIVARGGLAPSAVLPGLRARGGRGPRGRDVPQPAAKGGERDRPVTGAGTGGGQEPAADAAAARFTRAAG